MLSHLDMYFLEDKSCENIMGIFFWGAQNVKGALTDWLMDNLPN